MDTIIKRCQVCVLKHRIKYIKWKMSDIRSSIISRNLKYHNGRLEVDSVYETETEKFREKIFTLKRKIIDKK